MRATFPRLGAVERYVFRIVYDLGILGSMSRRCGFFGEGFANRKNGVYLEPVIFQYLTPLRGL